MKSNQFLSLILIFDIFNFFFFFYILKWGISNLSIYCE